MGAADRVLVTIAFVVLACACQSAPSPGASCTTASDCASPLVCHFGRCRAQCAANRDCPLGSSCLLDSNATGACSLDTDRGCESGGRGCPSGLTCVGDRCVQPCGGTVGCATGSACVAIAGTMLSFCADPAVTTDAGSSDASIDAATDGGAMGVGTACIGHGFVCATAGADSSVYCWGRRAGYSLAHAPGAVESGCTTDLSDVDHALAVSLSDVDQLTCGEEWLCAHQRTGDVWCWGDTNFGQLRPGGAALCERTPQRIETVSYTDGELASTAELACALDRTARTIRCWGGDESTVHPSDAILPNRIVTLPGVVTLDAVLGASVHPLHVGISSGMNDPNDSTGGGCVVDSDFQVHCWGANQLGQAGAAPSAALTAANTVTGLPASASAIAVGAAFACALFDDRSTWCWGIDGNGELLRDPSMVAPCTTNLPSTYPCDGAPHPYGSPLQLSAITAHASTSSACAIASGGTSVTAGDVYCWGSGEFLVNTQTDQSSVFDPLFNGHVRRSDGSALANAQAVFVAYGNACAIDRDGALWCWGANDNHQLQIADTASQARAQRMRVP